MKLKQVYKIGQTEEIQGSKQVTLSTQDFEIDVNLR